MKRKRDQGEGVSMKDNKRPHTNLSKSSAGKGVSSRCPSTRLQRDNVIVPLSSVFKTLYEAVSNRTATTSTSEQRNIGSALSCK